MHKPDDVLLTGGSGHGSHIFEIVEWWGVGDLGRVIQELPYIKVLSEKLVDFLLFGVGQID